MKKFALLLFSICLILTNSQLVVFASTKYARIGTTTPLYKLSTDDDSIDNIYCLAEKSYFVEIISDNGDNYKVMYNSQEGYIKKSDVMVTIDTPTTLYPYNIQIITNSDCNLRKTPSTKSNVNNIIEYVPSGTTSLRFIGRVFSEEAIDFGGTTWYYVEYNGKLGYIYNKYVKSITPIYENTEVVRLSVENDINVTNPITHTPSLIIILIMLIPCIAVLIILYIPPNKIKRTKRIKTPKSIDRY